MIPAIDERLHRWAEWARKYEGGGMGYASATIEAELVRMGGVLIRGDGGPRRVEANHEAEETEIAVRAMPDTLRVSTHLRYLCPYFSRAKKLMVLNAKTDGLYSTRDYHRFVDEAHAWLVGYFAARRARKIAI